MAVRYSMSLVALKTISILVDSFNWFLLGFASEDYLVEGTYGLYRGRKGSCNPMNYGLEHV